MNFNDPMTPPAAVTVLIALGAPDRLTRHGEIVSEVATELSAALAKIGVTHNSALVRIAAVLHDVGKVVHPEELDGPGNKHEAAGERLLIEHGCSPELARFCRSHGQWDSNHLTCEEVIMALSDAIWKGERSARLEKLLITDVSQQLGLSEWEAFLMLDPIFERLANAADERLTRARG
jgi:hypothetical protein